MPRDAPAASVNASFMPVFSGGNSAKEVDRSGPYWDGVLNLGKFNWFHGKLSLEQVTEILSRQRKGSFLVRLSNKVS